MGLGDMDNEGFWRHGDESFEWCLGCLIDIEIIGKCEISISAICDV